MYDIVVMTVPDIGIVVVSVVCTICLHNDVTIVKRELYGWLLIWSALDSLLGVITPRRPWTTGQPSFVPRQLDLSNARSPNLYRLYIMYLCSDEHEALPSLPLLSGNGYWHKPGQQNVITRYCPEIGFLTYFKWYISLLFGLETTKYHLLDNMIVFAMFPVVICWST